MNVINRRLANIELLRVISAFGVIILHMNSNSDWGGVFQTATIGSVHSYVAYFLESIFICAVNVFMIISGYFMGSRKKICIIKPFMLLVQVSFFSEFFYLVEVILKTKPFSLTYFIGYGLPRNYFVILYIGVYIMAPYINLIVEKIKPERLEQFIVTAILIFSVEPFLITCTENITGFRLTGLSFIGLDGDQAGYTIVNFMLLYLIGAYIRRKEKLRIGKRKLIVGLCIVWSLVMVWKYTGVYLDRATSVYQYNNPLIIIMAILTFQLFREMKVKDNKIITFLGKNSFAVYLGHAFFLKYINYEALVSRSWIFMFASMLLLAGIIYLILTFCSFLYDFFINHWMGKLKIIKYIETKWLSTE